MTAAALVIAAFLLVCCVCAVANGPRIDQMVTEALDEPRPDYEANVAARWQG